MDTLDGIIRRMVKSGEEMAETLASIERAGEREFDREDVRALGRDAVEILRSTGQDIERVRKLLRVLRES